MADVNTILSGIGSSVGGTLSWIMWAVVAIVVIGGVGGWIAWLVYSKQRWNLRVEFKLVRNDGRIIGSDWGKGNYSSKKGFVTLKRPKTPAYKMKPFDIKKYIQGQNTLTVVQIGANEWLPVLAESFTFVHDPVTGERASILNLAGKANESKVWKSQLERELKSAFSIKSVFENFQVPISIGIVAIMIFIGFAIIWGRLPSICKAILSIVLIGHI